MLNNNNTNIPSVIPQVGSVEGKMYADLTLPLWGREGVSNRPLAQKAMLFSEGLQKETVFITLNVVNECQLCIGNS